MPYTAAMASIFTRIIDGELPAHFVWRGDDCVAFLSINPLQPGHTLVVSRAEVDHWIDLDPRVVGVMFEVARAVGRAIQAAFDPRKIGLMVAGLEVTHAHVHVVPIRDVRDLDFDRADRDPGTVALEEAAARIRDELDLPESPS